MCQWISGRERLIGALHSHGRLKFVKRALIADVGYILEDCRPFVTIEILYRVVHRPELASVLPYNGLTAVLVREFVFLKHLKVLAQLWGQMDTLHSVDFCKRLAADSVALRVLFHINSISYFE
jgi:hypothetical protein